MNGENISPFTRLSVFFAQKGRISILFLAATLFVGFLSYNFFLKREGFPPIDVPLGVVSTPYFINDSQKVDSQITKPMEVAIAEIEEVKTISSTTSENFSNIFVEFEEGLSSKDGIDLVKTKISDIKGFPQSAEPQYIVVDAGKFDGQYDLIFTISSKDKTVEEIQAKAEEIADKISKNSAIQSAKALKIITTETNPLTGETIENVSGYNRVGVKENDSLVFTQAISIGVVRENVDQGTIEFSQEVRDEIKLLEEKGLLDGYETIFSFGDFSISLEQQIDSLEENTIAAMFIILGIIFLFINWRASIVTVIFIPTVLAATFIAFFLMGYSLNVLSLFGLILVLGLFVDDGTVVVEAIDYQKKRGVKGIQAIINAVQKVGIADVSGTITTLLVFVPMALISGVLGEFIRIIPITVITALALSLVYALTIIPFLSNIILTEAKSKFIRVASSLIFLIIFGILAFGLIQGLVLATAVVVVAMLTYFGMNQRSGKNKSGLFDVFDSVLSTPNNFVLKIGDLIARFVKFYLKFPQNLYVGLPLFILSIGLIFGAMAMSSKLEFNIFPTPKDTESFNININYPQGNSIESAESIAEEIENNYIKKYSDHITNVDYFASNEDSAQIFVTLTRMKDREITSTTLVDELNAEFEKYSKASIKAEKASVGPPTSDFPYQMQVYTESQQTLESASDKIKQYLLTVELDNGTKVSEVVIENLDNISKNDGKRYSVIRAKLSSTENATGNLVSLRDKVEEFYTEEKLAELNLESDALGFDLGQESENLDSFNSAIFAMLASLLMMYVLLVLQFDSFTQPLLVFLAIPFSFPGLIPGLYFTDNPLSFFVMIGIIGLMGIVVNNSIMLLDFAKQARLEGQSIADAISGAVRERFRPMITTSATTVTGLLPLALSDPFWESLAFSIIFGLISSTTIVILVFPYYYFILEKGKNGIYKVTNMIKSKFELAISKFE